MCGEVGHFCVSLRVVVFGRLVSLSVVCAFPMHAVREACNQCTTAQTRTCHVAMASGFTRAHKVSVRMHACVRGLDCGVLLFVRRRTCGGRSCAALPIWLVVSSGCEPDEAGFVLC